MIGEKNFATAYRFRGSDGVLEENLFPPEQKGLANVEERAGPALSARRPARLLHRAVRRLRPLAERKAVAEDEGMKIRNETRPRTESICG